MKIRLIKSSGTYIIQTFVNGIWLTLYKDDDKDKAEAKYKQARKGILEVQRPYETLQEHIIYVQP